MLGLLNDNMEKGTFNFNPFSGVHLDEIEDIIIPQFEIQKLVQEINKAEPILIEFIGKQGRGKTIHLKWLHKQISRYPIFLLRKKSDKDQLMQTEAEVIFIDSIHHLSFADRIRLFRQKKTVIYTTHWPRKIECLIAGKERLVIPFKGIDPIVLKTIIEKRLRFASKEKEIQIPVPTDLEIQKLIEEHQDDYRGIINALYDQYQA